LVGGSVGGGLVGGSVGGGLVGVLGIGVLVLGTVVGVLVGLRVLVGPGVLVGCGIGVLVGCGTSVLVGRSMSVLVGRALVGSGSGVEVRPNLWQSGSALSIRWSPSSSKVLKQYSLPPSLGFSTTGGISQMMIESKRIIASRLSKVSTNNPTSPLA